MLFEKIVCGVDGSEEGFVALAQARRLLAPGGRLVAVTACQDALAVRAGASAPRIAADLRAEADEARAHAVRQLAGLPNSEAVVARGRPADVLRTFVERERPDLLVVGSHGTSRALVLLLGSVATTMLRDAACPVLVARRSSELGSSPRIVVGVDGSAHAAEAEAVAAELAERLQASVRAVVAVGGEQVDIAAVGPQAEIDPRSPVAALDAASDDADLLVVGSRGLRGVAALGSVSERVAHRARCSVLVVRPGQSRSPERRHAAAVAG